MQGHAFTLDAQELQRQQHSERSRLWWASVPKCCALNRFGLPCRQPVKVLGDVCRWHGSGVARGKPRSEAGVRIAVAREHKKLMVAVWRHAPWAEGHTLVFTDEGNGEGVFTHWLAANGLDGDAMPPAVVDWARWCVRRLLLAREDVFGPPGHRLHDQVRRRMAQAGPPPAVPVADFSEQSDRDCARLGVMAKSGKPWVRPVLSMHERRRAAMLARERLGLAQRRQESEGASQWRPAVGPAQLTPAEARMLAVAAKLGAVQITRARADIEAGRRLFW